MGAWFGCDELDGFEGLEDTHEAHDGTEDAALATGEKRVCWRWFGEDAAVAGPACEISRWTGRIVEDYQLPFGLQGRGRNERFTGQNTGV